MVGVMWRVYSLGMEGICEGVEFQGKWEKSGLRFGVRMCGESVSQNVGIDFNRISGKFEFVGLEGVARYFEIFFDGFLVRVGRSEFMGFQMSDGKFYSQ